MKLHSLLAEDLVITDLRSVDRDGALWEIVEFLKARGRVSRDKELYEKLLQREKLGSTAIGDGVAIPHCKIKGLKGPLLALGVSRQGVAFDSLDGKPAHLFFLVISPPDDPTMSLKILAAIAQLIRRSTGLPRRVLEARTARDVLAAVRDEEDKAHG
jgi:nitrogen PTS system EIIA component